jgi:hypothetical protein
MVDGFHLHDSMNALSDRTRFCTAVSLYNCRPAVITSEDYFMLPLSYSDNIPKEDGKWLLRSVDVPSARWA